MSYSNSAGRIWLLIRCREIWKSGKSCLKIPSGKFSKKNSAKKPVENKFTILFDTISKRAGQGHNYLVWGYLRDQLMKKSSKDLDFVCLGDAEALSRQVANDLKGSFVILDEQEKIFRV